MRAQNASRTLSISFVFFIGLFVTSDWAIAQSGQYKKAKKTEVVAPAIPGAPEKPNKKEDKKDDKVDITDLEQKYWAPKDVEFSVVQNRLYSKAKRIGITPSIGPLLTDSFSSGTVYGLTGNYYFNERHGIELNYSKYDLKNSSTINGFIKDQGVASDYNRQQYFYGISYNWIPIYAKISLLDLQIMYFDMSISPGFGIMGYEQQRVHGVNPVKSSPAATLDIAQHYFLSKEFAIRIDMRNRFYKDEVIDYRTGVVEKTKFNHSVTMQFGFTYYFGFGE